MIEVTAALKNDAGVPPMVPYFLPPNGEIAIALPKWLERLYSFRHDPDQVFAALTETQINDVTMID